MPLRRLLRRTAAPCHRALSTERAVCEADVLIVGAGPAGLSAAIKVKQLRPELSVVVLEKASQVGGHCVSGAVVDPRALNELLPDWLQHEDACPLAGSPVQRDQMRLLTRRWALPLPVPPALHNRGNYIGSLAELVRWLGRRAEQLGVDIYAGFAGNALLAEQGVVVGAATNDVGVDRHGRPKASYERGMALRAKVTLLAEGCHGSLSKQAIAQYGLRQGRSFQTYGLGLKEVWQLSGAQRARHHQPGLVVHGVGWPLDAATYGGCFMYHYGDGLVSVGLVLGLDYTNPHLNPYQEFQRLKLHPSIRSVLDAPDGSRCIAYAARALNEGGWQSIPRLEFPGGALIGCAAGFVNVPRIKGTHTAMKSGMLAAEHLADNWHRSGAGRVMDGFETRLRGSWIADELQAVRNVRPAFHRAGLWGGLAYAALSSYISRGREPWTLSHGDTPDHATLLPAASARPPSYPRPDGRVTFDLMESVSRTGTNHAEDQPCHLQLKRPAADAQLAHNLPLFAGPEARFCPAGVYEYVPGPDQAVTFQINAQNCIHCKTCDIKDPSQNINWATPEGGGGPQYTCT